MMKVEFNTKALSDYYFCMYSGKQPFSEMILERYRKAITFITQTDNINTLSKFRGLNIENMKVIGQPELIINSGLSLIFVKPNTIVILKISKHYE